MKSKVCDYVGTHARVTYVNMHDVFTIHKDNTKNKCVHTLNVLNF